MAQPFSVNNPVSELPVWSVDGSGNVISTGAAQFTGPVTAGVTKTQSPGNHFYATDHGYIGWNADPGQIQGGTALVSGTLYFCRIPLRGPVSPSSIAWGQSAAAVTITAGQNFAGLYSSAGVLLASAGIDTQIVGTGIKNAGIAPGVVQPGAGWVWAALLTVATTPPTVQRFTNTGSPPNANLLTTQLRWAVAGSSLTALPATVDPTTLTSTGNITVWMALEQ